MYQTLAAIETRDDWVVVDSYVLDLSDFWEHHPGGGHRIAAKRTQLGTPDITGNFVDHFAETVQTFRDACRQFDEQNQTDQTDHSQAQPVTFSFTKGTYQNTAKAPVRIVGRINPKGTSH